MLSTGEILLHQVCTSEGSACPALRHVIFDDVMSYNSLTTEYIRIPGYLKMPLVGRLIPAGGIPKNVWI